MAAINGRTRSISTMSRKNRGLLTVGGQGTVRSISLHTCLRTVNCNQRFPPLSKRVRLQFLCIKTLSLQSVNEISWEWFKALQLAGATVSHWSVTNSVMLSGSGDEKWCNWCSLTSASPPLT